MQISTRCARGIPHCSPQHVIRGASPRRRRSSRLPRGRAPTCAHKLPRRSPEERAERIHQVQQRLQRISSRGLARGNARNAVQLRARAEAELLTFHNSRDLSTNIRLMLVAPSPELQHNVRVRSMMTLRDRTTMYSQRSSPNTVHLAITYCRVSLALKLN